MVKYTPATRRTAYALLAVVLACGGADDSVPLAGATNTQTACLGHSALYSDDTLYGQVRSWVR